MNYVIKIYFGLVFVVSLLLIGCSGETRDVAQGEMDQLPSAYFDVDACIADTCTIVQGKYWYQDCVAGCHRDKAKEMQDTIYCDPTLTLPYQTADGSLAGQEKTLNQYSTCVNDVAKLQKDSKTCKKILQEFNDAFTSFTVCVRGVAVLVSDPSLCEEITTAGITQIEGVDAGFVNDAVVQEWKNECIAAVG